jgi:hypothetical protein
MGALSPTWQKWYDRIDQFPKVGALVIFSIFCFFTTGAVIAWASLWMLVHDTKPDHEFINALDIWLDKVLWLSGIATTGVIGKRATTKADVIAASAAASPPVTDRDPDASVPSPKSATPPTDLSHD